MLRKMIQSVVGVLFACGGMVIVGAAAPARADVLLDTLPAHPQYYSNVATTQALAVRFTTTSSLRLQQVEMALGVSDGTPSIINSAIHADGSTPGTKIRDLTPTVVSPTGTYTAMPIATLDLSAGQSYWLVVSSQATNGRWFLSQAGSIGLVAVQNSGGMWSSSNTGLPPAVRVTANPLIVACCNAATGACTLLTPSVCTAAAGAGLASVGTACTPAACPTPCAADFNRSGSVSVQDIFDFLAAYFVGCP